MLENGNIVVLWADAENSVVTNHINLWDELDSYVAISTNDQNLLDLLSKNIYDLLISKILWIDTYTEISEILDTVNNHILNYTESWYNTEGLNIIVWVQEKNILYFSKVGRASALLIKQNTEVIEITEVKEKPNSFLYISNGDIKSWEIVLFSSERILNHLTNTEILESAALDSVVSQNQNISEIISEENVGKDIAIVSYRYMHEVEERAAWALSKCREIADTGLEKIWDTLIAKRLIATVFKLRDFLHIPANISKNTFLFFGVFAAFILLYYTSTSLFNKTDTIIVEDYKENLILAREYIEHAAENMANDDVFTMDLEKSEDLIDGIKDKQLFLWDIEKLLWDINALRKQFNQVDTYNFTDEKVILSSTMDIIKFVTLNSKVYYIEDSKVVWPVVNGIEPKSYNFDFSEDDAFVDAIELNWKILLLTEKNRMVSFNSWGSFLYTSAEGQESWEKAQKIDKYGSNLYTLSNSGSTTQIYKHKTQGNNFTSGESYLKEEDMKSIWNTLAMSIDGGFYLLKEDLSMLKFYSNPYRLESMFLNNLPKNYNYDGKSPVYLYTRSDLTYMYLFMNNKIWIFQPNTTNYVNTKSLKYIWQIEWWNDEINGFHVKSDGNLYVSNKNWVYKMTFQVSDDKLIIQ